MSSYLLIKMSRPETKRNRTVIMLCVSGNWKKHIGMYPASRFLSSMMVFYVGLDHLYQYHL